MFSIGQNTHDSFITIWTGIKNLWQANVNHAHSGHFVPATVWKVDVLHTKCAIKLVIEWGLPNKDIKETKLSALMINALRRNCMKFCNSGTKRTVYNREVYIFEEVSEKRCSIMFVNLVPRQKTIYTHFDWAMKTSRVK